MEAGGGVGREGERGAQQIRIVQNNSLSVLHAEEPFAKAEVGRTGRRWFLKPQMLPLPCKGADHRASSDAVPSLKIFIHAFLPHPAPSYPVRLAQLHSVLIWRSFTYKLINYISLLTYCFVMIFYWFKLSLRVNMHWTRVALFKGTMAFPCTVLHFPWRLKNHQFTMGE